MEENEKKKITFYVKLTISIMILLILLFGTIYTVKAGERGVLLTFGKASPEARGEGLNFKWPLIQKVIKMDVKTQKYEADLTAASKDLQDVKTIIAINYHIIPSEVPTIYRDIGVNYAEKVIYPLEQETNKGVTAQYTAEELITKREDVRDRMKVNLAEKLLPRGIIVEDISIINFEFSPSFTQAIEAKVTAEQNALAAKNKLEQVKYEAEQTVTKARADAEAIRIQVEAIRTQGGSDYVRLQFANKWNGILPQVTGGAVPFLSINSTI